MVCIHTSILTKVPLLLTLALTHKTINKLVVLVEFDLLAKIKDTEGGLRCGGGGVFVDGVGLLLSLLIAEWDVESASPMIIKSLPKEIVVIVALVVTDYAVHELLNVNDLLLMHEEVLCR